MKLIFVIFVFCLTSFVGFANEADHAGVIVKKEGEVEVYIPVAEKSDKAGVLYNGSYYSVTKAKLGSKVFMRNIIRTTSDGKAKIVYKNGDQYNVGENTFYEIYLEKGKYTKEAPAVRLLMGKIRSIISKDGPRKELNVYTSAASLGVRGTDFYVSNNGVSRGTDISVLRGEVVVNSVQSKTPEVKVTSGYTAQVIAPVATPIAVATPAPEVKKEVKEASSEAPKVERPAIEAPITPPTPPAISLLKTSQEELIEIQKSSVVKEDKKDKEALTVVEKKEIEVLEDKAVETVIADIKTHDPKLLATLDISKIKNSEVLNTKVVEEIFKEAPKAPQKVKFKDLNGIDSNPYEKYFRIEE